MPPDAPDARLVACLRAEIAAQGKEHDALWRALEPRVSELSESDLRLILTALRQAGTNTRARRALELSLQLAGQPHDSPRPKVQGPPSTVRADG